MAVLALTLVSAAVFVVVYVVLWVARARLAFVRAKNLGVGGVDFIPQGYIGNINSHA